VKAHPLTPAARGDGLLLGAASAERPELPFRPWIAAPAAAVVAMIGPGLA
jgi:hypothetical protein